MNLYSYKLVPLGDDPSKQTFKRINLSQQFQDLSSARIFQSTVMSGNCLSERKFIQYLILNPSFNSNILFQRKV